MKRPPPLMMIPTSRLMALLVLICATSKRWYECHVRSAEARGGLEQVLAVRTLQEDAHRAGTR